jgi:hypothetical protein
LKKRKKIIKKRIQVLKQEIKKYLNKKKVREEIELLILEKKTWELLIMLFEENNVELTEKKINFTKKKDVWRSSHSFIVEQLHNSNGEFRRQNVFFYSNQRYYLNSH